MRRLSAALDYSVTGNSEHTTLLQAPPYFLLSSADTLTSLSFKFFVGAFFWGLASDLFCHSHVTGFKDNLIVGVAGAIGVEVGYMGWELIKLAITKIRQCAHKGSAEVCNYY